MSYRQGPIGSTQTKEAQEMTSKRVILVGGTGMVGGLALRLCLDSDAVSTVTVMGRRSVGLAHAKLREVIHSDFADYHEVAGAFGEQDVALFCLGAYTGTVPDAELRKITVDYAVAFGETLLARSPRTALCFLSGAGADQREQTRVAFARYKGIAENALLRMGFPRVHIFRPGYIYPVTPRKEPHVLYRIARVLYPVVRHIYPNIGIASDDLARAMVHAGLHGTGAHESPVLENRDIRALVATLR
jgi:uncharacterized protein YbjT (DUF2867 family)